MLENWSGQEINMHNQLKSLQAEYTNVLKFTIEFELTRFILIYCICFSYFVYEAFLLSFKKH